MKMKYRFLFCISFLLLLSCSKNETDESAYIDDDLAGPVSRPESGYGSDGNYKVAKINFPNPSYSGKNVEFFIQKE